MDLIINKMTSGWENILSYPDSAEPQVLMKQNKENAVASLVCSTKHYKRDTLFLTLIVEEVSKCQEMH